MNISIGHRLAAIALCLFIGFPVAAQNRRAEGETAVADAISLRSKGDKASLLASIAKFEEALSIWLEIGDPRAEYAALDNIGALKRETGEAARSLEYYEKALVIARGLADKKLECYTLLYEGVSYDALGDAPRQLEIYARALPLARELKDQILELSVLASIGVAYYRLGNFQNAISYYDQTLPLFRSSGNKEGEMSVLANMGAIYFTLGDYQGAIDRYKLALPLSRQLHLEQVEATILGGFGNCYLSLNDPPKALDYFNQALEIKKRIGDRIGEAVTLIDIASVHVALKDPVTALDFNKRALELHRELKLRRSEGYSLNNIGKLYIDLQDYQKAYDNLILSLPIRREVGDLQGESVTLSNLSSAELAMGRANDALTHIEQAIAIIESMRVSLASQGLRESFFSVSQGIYKLRIDILMSLHAQQPGQGYDEKAFQASERARARSLLDLLAEAKADIRQGVDQSLIARESALRETLIRKETERQRAKTSSQAAAFGKEIDDLAASYAKLQSEIRLKSPRYAALTQTQPVGLKDIQRLLDPETKLLEYSLGAKKSYLWIVSQNSLRTYELPKAADIESISRAFFGAVSKANQSNNTSISATQLSKILIEPAKADLANDRLVIVADGILQYVPFSALVNEAGEALVVNHEITYIPSASTLFALRDERGGRQSPNKTIAVLADPVFDAKDTRVGRSATENLDVNTNSPLAKATRDAGISGTLPRLPGTRREAATILSFVPENERKRAIDFEANLATVNNPTLGQYRIIHFATHGLLNSVHPELSGIVLSLVDKTGKSQEGFLRLNDIYNLKLPADLIVLSACQTALGKEVRGEGLIGLTRGFMYAGARRIVASQWAVDDQATSELMKLFYQGMLGDKKLRPAAALREAQIALLKTKRFSAPYYWSAFTIQGEWK